FDSDVCRCPTYLSGCPWARHVSRQMMTSAMPLLAKRAARRRKGVRGGCREGTLTMSRDFVRYSPDVERADPNFEQSLHTILKGIATISAGASTSSCPRRRR